MLCYGVSLFVFGRVAVGQTQPQQQLLEGPAHVPGQEEQRLLHTPDR